MSKNWFPQAATRAIHEPVISPMPQNRIPRFRLPPSKDVLLNADEEDYLQPGHLPCRVLAFLRGRKIYEKWYRKPR